MAYAVHFHWIVNGHPFVDPTGGPAYELAAVYLTLAVSFILLGPGRLLARQQDLRPTPMIGNRRTARRAFWPALSSGVALGCSSPVPNNPQVTPSDRILVAVAPASASASIRRLEELLKLRDLKYEIVSRGEVRDLHDSRGSAVGAPSSSSINPSSSPGSCA